MHRFPREDIRCGNAPFSPLAELSLSPCFPLSLAHPCFFSFSLEPSTLPPPTLFFFHSAGNSESSMSRRTVAFTLEILCCVKYNDGTFRERRNGAIHVCSSVKILFRSNEILGLFQIPPIFSSFLQKGFSETSQFRNKL